jgi:3-methyladenine DNA glycosylase/8-oxoguanine DNA glycosylase
VVLPGPVDPHRTLRRLAPFRFDPTAHPIDGAMVCAFRTPDGPAAIAYRRAGERAVDAEAWGPGAARALAAAADHLGARDRPETLVTDDPVVAPLLRRFRGLRFGRTGRLLEKLIPTILAQKVTGAGAARSWRDLLVRHGERAPGPFAGLWVPPTVERLRELAYYDFHPLGVERRRAETILGAVRRARRLERLVEGSAEDAEAALRALPGIGPWTAASVVGGVFGDADAVPVGDYHLPHIVTHAFTGEARGTDARMLELLEPFRPHRGRVLALLLAGGHGPPRHGPRLPIRDIRRR